MDLFRVSKSKKVMKSERDDYDMTFELLERN